MGGRLGVLFETGVHGPYETISFAAFQWNPPKPRSQQHWNLTEQGTLTTDGENCLQWKVEGGYLTSGNAGDLVLDWTSKENPDGGHRVYMNTKQSSLPHQQWHFEGPTLVANNADGLCLDWLPPNSVEMR